MAIGNTDRIKTAAGIGLVLAGMTLAGCTQTHQFGGMLHYGNLMSDDAAETSEAGAKEQILALAESYGLETRYIGDNKMHFVAQAPTYTVSQPDGAVEERADSRLVHVQVKFGDSLGSNAYRYYCWVEGNEPVLFEAEDRARFALALLAVREIFEKPIATDFLGN
tara:strand:- start:234 stop:728 length:495 start_codon:yes stop_codon:yes gene_type:complete